MRNKLVTACVLVLVGALAVVVGCSKKKGAPEESTLAAKVDKWTATRQDVEDIIKQLPEHQKQKYDSPEGKADLADRLIEEEVYHREGLKKQLKNDPKVRDMVEKYERGVIVTEFFNREIKPKASPSEQEVHDYYESHKETYTIQPVIRAQHILMPDSLKLVKLMKRVQDGEKFTTLAVKYSEDGMTKSDGGSLGYFNPGGYIRGIGYSQEIGDAAASMRKGDMKIVKWEKGYSLLVVTEYRPAELRPYEEVQSEIKELLTQQKLDEVQRAAFTELKKNYDVKNYLSVEMSMTERTPEELWNLAQNSTDSYQRLRYYEQIVEKFPKSDYAAEAQFMIGFVYAEELKSSSDADRAFNKVITEYPNSEVAKTAEWMLKNMNKPMPEFQDLKDLQKKIESEAPSE